MDNTAPRLEHPSAGLLGRLSRYVCNITEWVPKGGGPVPGRRCGGGGGGDGGNGSSSALPVGSLLQLERLIEDQNRNGRSSHCVPSRCKLLSRTSAAHTAAAAHAGVAYPSAMMAGFTAPLTLGVMKYTCMIQYQIPQLQAAYSKPCSEAAAGELERPCHAAAALRLPSPLPPLCSNAVHCENKWVYITASVWRTNQQTCRQRP